MSIRITDEAMTSDVTPHTAARSEDGMWTVTWLKGVSLDRNQAITAMTLAETVAQDVTPVDRMWPHVVGWANELGVAAHWAVKRIRETS